MSRILCFCLLFVCQIAWAQSLLILGDSLSAGYQMETNQSWAHLIKPLLEKNTSIKTVINASISGDTTGNALDRLPDLLTQHKPQWVLIELGANDGLRGFTPNLIEENLTKLITLIEKSGAKAMLMQIFVPPNYGRRYSQAFAAIYPKLSQTMSVPLLPFFMETVAVKKQWMMQDGLHPNAKAQPWIAQFIATEIENVLKRSKVGSAIKM